MTTHTQTNLGLAPPPDQRGAGLLIPAPARAPWLPVPVVMRELGLSQAAVLDLAHKSRIIVKYVDGAGDGPGRWYFRSDSVDRYRARHGRGPLYAHRRAG